MFSDVKAYSVDAKKEHDLKIEAATASTAEAAVKFTKGLVEVTCRDVGELVKVQNQIRREEKLLR